MLTINGAAEFGRWIGRDLGSSGWLLIDQSRIDLFAEATGDRQWIHVDTERADQGPHGRTIAHGYLSLSLLSALSAEVYTVEGYAMTVNYGLNRVRYPAPVPVGSQVRNTVRVLVVEETPKGTLLTLRHTLEISGSERPAVVAEQLRLLVR